MSWHFSKAGGIDLLVAERLCVSWEKAEDCIFYGRYNFYGNTILTSGLDFKGRRLTGMEFQREEVGMRVWHFQGCRWICLTLCSEPGGLRLVVLRKDLQGEKNVTIHWLASYWLNYGEKNSVLISALDFFTIKINPEFFQTTNGQCLS